MVIFSASSGAQLAALAFSTQASQHKPVTEYLEAVLPAHLLL
jgi:hypothetical protein